MTPVELLEALKKETEEALKGCAAKDSYGNYVKINIFTYNLPDKKKKGREEREVIDGIYPYVLIYPESGEIDGGDKTKITFVIGIWDESEDNQGEIDVLNIITSLQQYFYRRCRIAGNAFSLALPWKWALAELKKPYSIGYIETEWTIPYIMEGENLNT